MIYIENISLRNKYLNLNKKIKYITHNNYITVKNGEYDQLTKLRNCVACYLQGENELIINYATGYKAKITKVTLNKIIHPTKKFNSYSNKYINNLNAACNLKKLFENAVYIDSIPPMKGKSKNPNEIGYHHFVAPLFMNDRRYRVLITTREKINSNILYVVSLEILPEYSNNTPFISVEDLVKDIKIWNYDLKKYHIYNIDNIVCDKHDDNSVYKIESEILILH